MYLGTTKEWMSEQEIWSRTAIAKEVFNRGKQILCSRINLDLRKRLVKFLYWEASYFMGQRHGQSGNGVKIGLRHRHWKCVFGAGWKE